MNTPITIDPPTGATADPPSNGTVLVGEAVVDGRRLLLPLGDDPGVAVEFPSPSSMAHTCAHSLQTEKSIVPAVLSFPKTIPGV
jgi:hypothetical protein